MRAQDKEPASTSQPRKAPKRAADPTPMPFHPAMPLTPQTILHLQRTVGNAAVARLIEAQRRDSDDPREDNGQHVQRSAVPDVLRSPGRPLDDDTRTEMEARLGADFSDVRIHQGGAARASAVEVGAAAYTSGNHVVLGEGGGDRHTLAHELVHVVQQRKGPVAGTDTGTGLRVSDPGDRFEREAEDNAHRALAGAPAHDHGHPREDARPRSHLHAAGQVPVQREVVAQIVAADANAEEPTVGRLILEGRPKSPHSGTEGDHTTAYVVLTQAVRRVIDGKTATEAAEGVWQLYQEAKDLPGGKLRDKLGPAKDKKHIGLIKGAEEELKRLYELPNGKHWDIPRLQQLISEYLEYRGTLPLSTLNTKATSRHGHGKGHGESGHVGLLNSYKPGDTTVSTDAIKEAMYGLLDEGALTKYATDPQTTSDTMAPGTKEYSPVGEEEMLEKRIEVVRMVVEQHVASVAQAFPAAFKAAWSDPKKAPENLMENLEEPLKDEKAKQIKFFEERLAETQANNSEDQEHHEKILKILDPTRKEEKKEEALGRGMRSKNKRKANPPDIASSPRKKPRKSTGSGSKKRGREGETESRIATQLVIDESGKITKMRSGGRAASPFSGTMGAHTTAWIVLVDFIHTQLVGKSVTDAVGTLPKLLDEVKRMEDRLKLFEEAGEENLATKRPVATVQANMEQLVKTATDAPVDTQAVLLLQQAVGAILERINIIPGVTRDGAATGGSGEAKYRDMLVSGKRGRKGEEMNEKDYQDAVFGLLDMKESLDHEQLPLMKNHLAIIKKAYPKVLTSAGLSEEHPQKALDQWKKRGKNPEDPFVAEQELSESD